MPSAEQPFSSRRILVCVSASIAAYKSAFIVRELVKMGAFVSVALTPAATRFVGTATFSALASEPAYDNLWDNRGAIAHTTLAKNADLVLVVPATASTMAKMAHGSSDDIVSACLLCTPASTPVVIAPAMHEEMWDHPATQENLATLQSRGVYVVGPVDGVLAGGDSGRGRLEDPENIIAEVQKALDGQPLRSDRHPESARHPESGHHPESGRHPDSDRHPERSEGSPLTIHQQKPVALITAGGTREPIDPVRVISNKSTGKMGHAIANAASASGYRTILITTSSLECDPEIERIDVDTAAQMHEAVMKYLGDVDCVVMTAAVADVTPAQPSSKKLKRSDGIEDIKVVPTPDIVADIIAQKKDDTKVVCFAAESDDVLENARLKFVSKGVDMLVVNDVSREDSGFGSATNRVWIFTAEDEKPVELPTLLKEELAFDIVDRMSFLSHQ